MQEIYWWFLQWVHEVELNNTDAKFGLSMDPEMIRVQM